MESLKRSIRYQFMEAKKFILGFWITIILVDIFFYILNYAIPLKFNIGFSLGMSNSRDISIVGINLMAILISLLVYNYESNYERFPLSLSLSMSRKDYFFSFLLDNVFVAFVFAGIQGVLLKIDPFFVELVGKIPLYEFIYFNTKTDNLLFVIFNLFLTFLGFICFWNLISSINYKIGYKMWLIFVGFNIFLSIFNFDFIYKGVEFVVRMFDTKLGTIEVLVILVGIVVFYIFNYFVVISTDVKRNRRG